MVGTWGHCGVTTRGGNCSSELQGGWPLASRQAANWDRAREACTEHCRTCLNCRYVYFSLQHSDCSWYAGCNIEKLARMPQGFRTMWAANPVAVTRPQVAAPPLPPSLALQHGASEACSWRKRIAPHFAIVGTAKGGTTSLTSRLLSNGICMVWENRSTKIGDMYSRLSSEWKITDFLSRKREWQIRWSRAAGSSSCASEGHTRADEGKADSCESELRGFDDPLVSYLAPTHADLLHRVAPDLQVVFIVREPIQRAFSHWHMEVVRGRQPEAVFLHVSSPVTQWCSTFSELVQFELSRLDKPRSRYDIIRRGLYAEQIAAFLNVFAAGQLLVLVSERLLDDGLAVAEYNQLCEFLGLAKVTKLRDQSAKEARIYAPIKDSISNTTACILHDLYRPSNHQVYRYLGGLIPQWEVWYDEHVRAC